MIYSSNLCTEILQNQSPSEPASPKMQDQTDHIVQITRPGDLVVCNLASIHLGHMHTPDDIDRTIPLVIRMLDDVITVNHLPVPQATRTNLRYRAIGLGVHGYQQYLVAHGIPWESEAHVQEADALFERIAYRALEASHTLAVERGAYPFFPGSGWDTGAIFAQRGYTSESWQTLQAKIHTDGLRNGYLLAIAPTGSTSILADATPGIDPVFDHTWREDKQGFAVTRIAPGMTLATRPAFNTAHHTDQTWSIRAAGARQRHLDQAQSLNLYRTPTMDARMLSDWYFLAWEQGIKTVYYFRNFRPDDPPRPSAVLPTIPADSTHTDSNAASTPPTIVCLGCEL
jgi:ribonucleoside-diphosphate reductase alpha chain